MMAKGFELDPGTGGASGANTIVLDAGDSTRVAVPGGDFLLKADFSRQGDDLILSGEDGTTVVVQTFFSRQPPPTLETFTGAQIAPDLAMALAGPLTPGMTAQAGGTIGGQPIGTVKSIEGEVFATRVSGAVDTLATNDPVFQGDVITTGSGSEIGIVFVDGTNFSMGGSARMVLDNLIYNAASGDGGMGVSVLQGAFAFITGSIAKGDGEGMSVRTPVATIGIRGTTVNADVQVEGVESRFTLSPDLITKHIGVVEVSNAGGVQILDEAFESTTVSSFFSSPTPPQIIPPVNFQSIHGNAATLLEKIYLLYLEDERRRENGQDDEGGGGGGDRAGLDPTAEELASIATAAGSSNGQFIVTIPWEPPKLPDLPEGRDNPGDEFTRRDDAGGDRNNDEIPINEDTGPTSLQLFGTDGDDILIGGAGDDFISGGAGNDTIFGGAGNDTILGGDGDDFVDGGSGNDNITATPGKDTVIGGSGNDVINTGEEDDTVTGGAGNDTIDGGDGTDTAIYSGDYDAGAGYTITIVDGVVTVVDTDASDGDDGTDTLTGIEHLEFADETLDISTLPTVSIGDVEVDEDDGTVTFTLTKTGAAVLPLTVDYASADGTAVDGLDYTGVSGSVTFAPGETEKTVVVTLIDDSTTENTEEFSLNLSNPVNGTIGTGTGTATVNDDDTVPTDIVITDSSVAEDAAAGTVVGTLSAIDPDEGDTHTFSFAPGGDGGGRFVIVGDQLQVAPGAAFDHETEGSVDVTVIATDSDSLTYQETITVAVSDVNEAPTDIGLSSSNIFEDAAATTVVGTLSATDVDAGDTHSFSFAPGGDGGGRFVIVGTELRVAAGASFDFETEPTVDVTIIAEDSGNETVQKTLTVTVTDVNEDPTDIAITASSVAEDAAPATVVGVLSASDPDEGDSHTFSFAPGGDGGGRFAIIGNELRVADGAGFDHETEGSIDVTVIATDDGTGNLTYQETISVTVTDVNEDPTDIAITASLVPEDAAASTAVGTLSASDPDDGDTHTFAFAPGGNGGGRFVIEGGVLKVASGAAFDHETEPTVDVTVIATDSGGKTYQETLAVTVTDVNETPSVNDEQSFNVAENSGEGTVVGTVLGSDPDGDTLQQFQIVSGNADGNFVIDPATGQITVAENADIDFEQTTSYELGITVSDGAIESEPVGVTINVLDVAENFAVVQDQIFLIAENSPSASVIGTIAVEDAGSSPTFAIVSGNELGKFVIDPATGVISVADGAQLDFEGPDGISLGGLGLDFLGPSNYVLGVTVTNGSTTSDPEDVIVSITDVNETPVVNPGQFTNFDENAAPGTLVRTISAVDDDHDDVLQDFQIVSGNEDGNFTINPNNGEIHVAPGAVLDFEGTDTYVLGITVSDGVNTSEAVDYTVFLQDVNEQPQVDVPLLDQLASENAEFNYVFDANSFSDPDAGDTLTYEATLSGGGALPTWLGFDPLTGTFSGTPSAADVGTTTVRVTASDNDGLSTFDEFDIVTQAAPSGVAFAAAAGLFLAGGDSSEIKPGATIYLGAEFEESGEGTGTLTVDNDTVVRADEIHVGIGGLIEGDGTIMADVFYDGGTLAPGHSVGSLAIDGNLDFDGHMDLEIAGLLPGDADFVSVTGDADLTGGTMTFSFIDGFLSSAGDAIEVVSVDGAMSGDEEDFAYDVAGLADGFQFDVNFNGGRVVLTALNDANTGDDILAGDSGDNVLNGGAGNDQIDGGLGNDVLIGGSGADALTGGADADVFLYKSLTDARFVPDNGGVPDPAALDDTITDFDGGDGDKIGFDATAFGVSNVVDGETFALIGGTYDGSNGAGTAWDTGEAAFLFDDTGTLYHDANGADDGYTVVAQVQGVTLQATDFQVENA